MKTASILHVLMAVVLSSISFGQDNKAVEFRQITAETFKDKMMAAWVGQMAGVSLGGPTEAKACGELFPEDKIDKWTPELINGSFEQDDLYVEMTFLNSLDKYGIDLTCKQAGIDFANSRYVLWAANNEGRHNLRKGIAPPDSGNPKWNMYSAMIDYQIEADYSGIIAPGLPGFAVEMGEKFGSLMNYADGIYGGQFMGAMYSNAYFEKDIEKLMVESLKSIPAGSKYAGAVRDLLKWHRQYPDDWKKSWQLITDKYHTGAGFKKSEVNITAVLNGAYVCMGLLYGRGEPLRTMSIAIQCGQDSDCNPSSAAGVLFTMIGYKGLADEYKTGMNRVQKFSFTNYNFDELVEVCDKLARKVICKEGGRIEKTADGKEIFLIPQKAIIPSRLAACDKPEQIKGDKYSDEEMKLITEREPEFGDKCGTLADLGKFMPGWQAEGVQDHCGFFKSYGKAGTGLFADHKVSESCVFSRNAEIPAEKKTRLHVAVGHHFQGNFWMTVKADGKEMLKKLVDRDISKDFIYETDVDLTPLAGKTVKIEIVQNGNDGGYKSAYWLVDKIKIISE
jgi:hypothetical protein